MAKRKSLYEWKMQMSSDKRLLKQAKQMRMEGHEQQTGYKISGGKAKPLLATEYYGGLYRQSLTGYKRALKRKRK